MIHCHAQAIIKITFSCSDAILWYSLPCDVTWSESLRQFKHLLKGDCMFNFIMFYYLWVVFGGRIFKSASLNLRDSDSTLSVAGYHKTLLNSSNCQKSWFTRKSVSVYRRMRKNCCTCSQLTSVAFDLQNRWQDTFYQCCNPHIKYWNNSSLITAESQAADKFQSRWASQAEADCCPFFIQQLSLQSLYYIVILKSWSLISFRSKV